MTTILLKKTFKVNRRVQTGSVLVNPFESEVYKTVVPISCFNVKLIGTTPTTKVWQLITGLFDHPSPSLYIIASTHIIA